VRVFAQQQTPFLTLWIAGQTGFLPVRKSSSSSLLVLPWSHDFNCTEIITRNVKVRSDRDGNQVFFFYFQVD